MMTLIHSEKPRKQRKARFEAPMHMKQHFMAVHLAKELRERLKTKRRSLLVREGDKVKIMRGEFGGHSSKVARVDVKRGKVYVEGIARKRGKGGESLVPIEPSKLLMVDANVSDKMRGRILERSKKIE